MFFIKRKLLSIEKRLHQPFPDQDIEQLIQNHQELFSSLPDDICLFEDLNDYCMSIAGVISYVLAGKVNKIPAYLKDIMMLSFFERYPHYNLIKSVIPSYPALYQELKDYEAARKVALKFIQSE